MPTYFTKVQIYDSLRLCYTILTRCEFYKDLDQFTLLSLYNMKHIEPNNIFDDSQIIIAHKWSHDAYIHQLWLYLQNWINYTTVFNPYNIKLIILKK